MKKFCVGGPIDPERHYFIPKRLNWAHLDLLLADMEYFVLHAPRQTGKTTAIKEYIKYLNGQGQYRALHINMAPAGLIGDNIKEALGAILAVFKNFLQDQLPEEKTTIQFINHHLSHTHLVNLATLLELLELWTKASARPTVLFMDEIDALSDDPLLSVLQQIRAGFDRRPQGFPQSLCLIGVRDLRDYKIRPKEKINSNSLPSPFNIKTRSLRLGDFSENQVRDLYLQHTEATGQLFTNEAIHYTYYLTQGQPWLVNALGDQACFSQDADRSQPVTKEVIEHAKEKLIIQRDVHLEALLARLNDERVRSVIDPIISGSSELAPFSDNDLQYVCDLGLIKQDNLEIANPIYKEIIQRSLVHC
jgi:hypothetical protein